VDLALAGRTLLQALQEANTAYVGALARLKHAAQLKILPSMQAT
jgi:hypothetical protein